MSNRRPSHEYQICFIAGLARSLLRDTCSSACHREIAAVSADIGSKQPSRQNLAVSGFLVLEENGFQLYDSSDAYKKRQYSDHCISLLISRPNFELFHRFSRSIVTVTGLFRSSVSNTGLVQLGGCNDSAIEVAKVESSQ
jgi:hypothetical protein